MGEQIIFSYYEIHNRKIKDVWPLSQTCCLTPRLLSTAQLWASSPGFVWFRRITELTAFTRPNCSTADRCDVCLVARERQSEPSRLV
jgi:hypothetical protein